VNLLEILFERRRISLEACSREVRPHTNLVILLEFLCFVNKNLEIYIRIESIGRNKELNQLGDGLIIQILGVCVCVRDAYALESADILGCR